MLNVLAQVSDEWVIGFGIMNLISSVLLGLGLYQLNTRQRRMETLEDKVSKAASEAVDQKLRAIKMEIVGPIAALESEAERVDRRLEIGETEFKTLREEDHKLRLEVIARLDRLNEKLDVKYATQGEVKRLEERVSKLEAGKPRA